MKKSFIKRTLSLLMAVLMLAVPISEAFAYTEFDREQTCPYVFVHGFMGSDIYVDKDDLSNDDLVWPPSTDTILDVVKECVPDLLKFLVTKNYSEFADAITEPCKKLFDAADLDESGNPKDNSGPRFKYPESGTITKDSQLSFKYDWRIDPIEVAAQLDEFIEYVCEESGCDQVTLECHSFGGVITLTYTTLYGYKNRLKSVCYNSSAIYGEQYTGELLSGNIKLDADSLTEFLKEALGETEYSKLLDGVFDILEANGITGDLCTLLNKLIEEAGDDVIREVVAPLFAGWLSIWAMIPDDYVDSCMSYIFDNIYKNDNGAHAGLKEKVVSYNEKVRKYKTQTLINQNESDTNVYVYARYGFCSVPLCDSWDNMSDSVIDFKYASMGGTALKYNETLGDDYLASANKKYISPDKNIDLSTCLFPDQTWAIRNMKHAENSDSMDVMTLNLLYSDGQATVDTYEQYPQFMKYTSSDDSISPDEGSEETEVTFFDKIFNFFLEIRRKITAFFDKIGL